MISISKIPEGWEAWLDELVQLDAARDALKGNTPAIREARDGLCASIQATLDDGLSRDLPVDLAGRIFCSLSARDVEAALLGAASSVYARLAERSSALISRFKVLPRHVQHLSEPAISRYIDLGLRYDLLAKDRAHELSLTRSAAYGLDIWRASHPRKSPVLAYWEAKGMTLPSQELSQEGIALITEQIHACAKHMHVSLIRKVEADQRCDWRILLAIQLAAPASGGAIFHMYWKRSFGEPVAKALFKLIEPQSDHDRIKAFPRLQAAPSTTELLRMPAARPTSLDDVLPARAAAA